VLTLETITWLAGHWRCRDDTGVTEELWLPPAGGMMLGLNRHLPDDGNVGFEFLRIAEDSTGVAYYASPGGAGPTPFRLTAADDAIAVFENPQHDFPKRIEYRLDGEMLVASIAGAGPGPSWTFERVSERP